MADQRSDHTLRMREIARMLRQSDDRGAGEDWDQEITAVTEVPAAPRSRLESASEVDPDKLHPLARNARGLVESVPAQQRIWALLLVVVAAITSYVLYQVL